MKKLFCIGAVGYGLLEILWRGYTHPAMLLCGGAGLCGIRKLCEQRRGVFSLCLQAAGMITAMELGVGMLVNRKYRVWDYRREWGNLAGQICPKFFALWFLLSLPFVIYFKVRR